MVTNLEPWSFTKLKAFENCPRSGYARYIAKTMPWVDTPEKAAGNEVHKALEDRLRDGVPLAPKFEWLEGFLPAPKEGDLLFVEEAMHIDGVGSPVFTPYGDEDYRWLTCKIDVLHIEGDDIAWIIDWKTGKPWEDPDQLQTYGAIVKAHYPHLRHWRGMYVWLRDKRVGDVHTLSPARSLERLRERIEKLDISDTPKKNKLCDWCPLKSCEHYTGAKIK